MRVTVYDIARELNIAQSTVSKALTNSSGVSDELRQKVLETAKRLGYRYNRYASSLARTSIKIGVTYPDVWHEYYSQIVKGIDEAITTLEDCNVSIVLKKFSSLYSDDEMTAIIDEFIAEGEVKGVLLFPSSTTFNPEHYRKLDEANLAYVVVANELLHKDKIPSVHVDAEMSGRVAAEALSLALPKGAKCATVIGTTENREHLKKMEGFIGEAKARGLTYVGDYRAMDMPELAYGVTEKLVSDHPDLAGIYIVSSNSLGVCQCIDEKYRDRGIKLVGTDIFDSIVPYMENGIMMATIYQSPAVQGRTAIMSLYDRIVTREPGQIDITVPPYLLMRSNYAAFMK